MEKRALKESVYCGAKYTRSQHRRQEWPRWSFAALANASLFNFAEAKMVESERGSYRSALFGHREGWWEGGNNEAIAKVSSR